MIIINQQTIRIKHYKLILGMSETILECTLDEKIVVVEGKKLKIDYYSESEIAVSGEFQCISFI